METSLFTHVALCVLVVSVVLPPTVSSQDQLGDSAAKRQLEICLMDVEDAMTCVGRISDFCQRQPAVRSEADAVRCVDQELAYWDKQLNQAYRRLQQAHAAQDRTEGTIEGNSVSSRAAALRVMQRQWIRYRDSKCGYERVLMGSGLAATHTYTQCLMQVTAAQALYLDAQ